MSEERGSAFDRAIDGAVREMLDLEPRADLRARVLRRLDRQAPVDSTSRRKILWAALPLAAAATFILALLPSQRAAHPTPAPAPTAGVETSRPPVPLIPAVNPPAKAPPRAALARRPEPVPRERQVVRAAALAGVEDAPVPGFPRVPSLSVPELSVPEIRTVAAVSAPTQLRVQPIAAPAPLDIEPLPLTPRERQEQE